MAGESLRVMVVARLFSGLVESLDSGQWRPRGVPAIYKLLEALADAPDIELIPVFAAKDADIGARFTHRRRVTVERLGGTVHILPYHRRPWLAKVRLDGKLRELQHTLRCLVLYWRFRPQVSYFTNANFVIAGLFARLRLGRVILRFLGLHPQQTRLSEGKSGLQKWFYRAPFDHVVCTLEGSGAPYYLPRLLKAGQPTSILLNGVDRPSPSRQAVAALKDEYGLGERPVVLFVGRLERNKGCREFVETLIMLHERRPDALDALIVGDGSVRQELVDRIDAAGLAGRVRLVGSVAHDRVSAFLAAADIYVSLNRLGSLSNANLEAIAAGKCMVILDKDPETHVDEETEQIVPADAALRIRRDDPVAGLAGALEELLDEPQLIDRYAARAAALGKTSLEGWGRRIARETEIIRAVAAGRSVLPVIYGTVVPG